MHIQKVRLINFRNFREAKLSPCPSVNVLFGENAQGKTNFIESIQLAIQGASFRTSDVKNLINDVDNSVAYLEMDILKNELQNKLKIHLSPLEKKYFLNEKKISKSTIRREFSTVLFSPESLSVIKNSDRERRDLIDDLIDSVFVSQRKVMDEHRRLLKQRNTLLKDFKENKYEINSQTLLYFETLTEKYLQSSAHVVETRLLGLERIIPRLQKVLSEIFHQNNVEIAVDYVISEQKFRSIQRQQAFDAMYKRWLQLKSAEIKIGHSLIGPHKHDICLLFNEKDSRYYCSQGQQRLLILAFKMAQIGLHFDVHGTFPILLLDDVLSEIDEIKRHKLMEVLETLRAQIFITTTENTVLRYLNRSSYSVFEVRKGQLNSKSGHQEEFSVR